MATEIWDILIIGGGPAGLSAAIYAGRARLSALTVEKDYGGRGMIASSERVDNYPGLPGIGGFELADSFRRQAKALGAQFAEAEITAIIPEEGSFRLTQKRGGDLRARTVIYAAGCDHRRLPVPGTERMGVSYCAPCDGAFYAGKAVAVVGGGDKALDDALYMANIAETVYLICRSQPRAARLLTEQAAARENIVLLSETEVVSIEGDMRVTGLRLRDREGERILPVSAVFTAIGMVPHTDLLRGLIPLDGEGYAVAGEDGMTPVPGLFVAGDVRVKPLRQVVTAAADGANAVMAAEHHLRAI